MNIMEARLCVQACVRYLREKDDSPRAAKDLDEAVEILIHDAEEKAAKK